MDDSALLRQYADNHSDEAFAELVTRHVNLVYSVALRQVGHPQNAEEITQAVFIILAKKAAGLRHEKALSSWLFQATRWTAINFVRSEIRRQNREQEAQMQTILNQSGGEVWPKIAPLLDDAVAALREKERRAIVLRFYEAGACAKSDWPWVPARTLPRNGLAARWRSCDSPLPNAVWIPRRWPSRKRFRPILS